MQATAVPESVKVSITRFPGGTLVTWVTVRYPYGSTEPSPQTTRVSSFLEDPAPTPLVLVKAALDAVRAQIPGLR